MACMPSRRVTSWIYSFAISVPFLLGKPLAGAESRRSHDIEISGVRGQIVRRPFNFEENGSLQSRECADAREDHRFSRADSIELHFLLEPVSGNVGSHIFD